MIIDLIDKSGNYIPTINRKIEKLVFRLSLINTGKYVIRTAFGPTNDFTSVFDVIPKAGTVRVKYSDQENWSTLQHDEIVITNELVKFIDIEITDIDVSAMISDSKLSCFARLKLDRVAVENENKVTIVSPYHPISLSETLSIEFTCPTHLNNLIRAAYINIDHHITGSPVVKIKATNTIIGGDQSQPITHNWTDIKNGDVTMIGPVYSERKGKYALLIKIEVNKSSKLDSYRLYNIMANLIESKIYAGGL